MFCPIRERQKEDSNELVNDHIYQNRDGLKRRTMKNMMLPPKQVVDTMATMCTLMGRIQTFKEEFQECYEQWNNTTLLAVCQLMDMAVANAAMYKQARHG